LFFSPIFNVADAAITTAIFIIIIFQKQFFKEDVEGSNVALPYKSAQCYLRLNKYFYITLKNIVYDRATQKNIIATYCFGDLGVGYVISGMYFGWNLGLEKGRYVGYGWCYISLLFCYIAVLVFRIVNWRVLYLKQAVVLTMHSELLGRM
jgi:hypothetical protein